MAAKISFQSNLEFTGTNPVIKVFDDGMRHFGFKSYFSVTEVSIQLSLCSKWRVFGLDVLDSMQRDMRRRNKNEVQKL